MRVPDSRFDSSWIPLDRKRRALDLTVFRPVLCAVLWRASTPDPDLLIRPPQAGAELARWSFPTADLAPDVDLTVAFNKLVAAIGIDGADIERVRALLPLRGEYPVGETGADERRSYYLALMGKVATGLYAKYDNPPSNTTWKSLSDTLQLFESNPPGLEKDVMFQILDSTLAPPASP